MNSKNINSNSKKEIYVDMSKITPYKNLPPININQINEGGVDHIFIDLTKEINTTEQEILTKIHNKIIKNNNDITKAINNKEIGKLKNKTNMNKRPGELSLNFSYDLNSPKVLSNNFTQTKEGFIECWLYSIILNTYQSNEQIFGMCLSFNIPFEVSFPLINHANHEIDKCTIKPIGLLKVSKETFDSIIFFHIQMYYDIFLLKEFNRAEFEVYKHRLFTPDTLEKKYLFLPLTFNHQSNAYQIDMNTISRCEELYYKQIGITLEQQLLNNKEKVVSLLMSNYLYCTSYRTWNIYKLKDILYANDTFDIFIDKLSSGIKDYKETIIDKYFTNANYSCNTRDIMTSVDCKAQSILGYKQLSNKYKIHINPKPVAYAYGMKMNFVSESFVYSKYILKNQCKTLVDMNDDSKKKKIIYPIFPIDHLIQFYLNTNQIELMMKFPSIFSTYEIMLIPYQMTIDFNLSQDITSTEAFNYFLWAGTTPAVMKDYDYESLEILGDSILKVILTIQLFANDDINQHQTAGQLENQRAQCIRNSNLYQIGINTHINQYIISKEYNIKEWDYPLKSTRQIYHQTITEKILADAIEGYIGACFLKSFNIADCIYFINKCKISADEIRANVEQYVNEKIIKNCFQWKPLCMVYIIKDLSFIHLLSLFNTVMSNIGSIDELENMINYSFKDKSLLYKAFTYYTFDKNDKYNNYEKLELLGDSIVESYVTTSLFYWYAPYMYNNNSEDKNKDIIDTMHCNSNDNNNHNEIVSLLKIKAQKFNNQNMTHIKSYLCSNNFMCQLSAFLQLYKFIQFGSSSSIQDTIKKFSHGTNLKSLIHRNLNNYESCSAFMPKMIADVFEALIGAIFCDSDLITTYKVLDMLYGPFVIYAGLYFDELKYSSVDDFTKKFNSIKKQTVDYRVLSSNNNNKANGEECEVGIFYSGDICYCTGKGKGIDNAKQQAAINGLEKLHKEEALALNK